MLPDSLQEHIDFLNTLSVTSNSLAKHTEKLPVTVFRVDTMSAKESVEPRMANHFRLRHAANTFIQSI